MSEEEIIEYLKQQRAYAHKFNNRQIVSITNASLNLIKKQQKEIQGLNKQANELVDDYEKQLQEKNEYIFRLESERDRWE